MPDDDRLQLEQVARDGDSSGEHQVPAPTSASPGERALDSGDYTASLEFFSGPLPPPEVLRQYSELLPDAVERIFKMAEQQAEHRQVMERASIRIELRGQAFGFVLALTSIVGGLILIAFDKPLIGAAASIGAVATLTGLFVWAKATRARLDRIGKERSPKTELDHRS